MRDIALLYLAYLSHDNKQVDMVAKCIADKAFRYGPTSEKVKIDTLDKVLDVINMAEGRI